MTKFDKRIIMLVYRTEEQKGGKRMVRKSDNEIADEIIELLKKENLTVEKAWHIISTVREKLHEKAYNTKIN